MPVMRRVPLALVTRVAASVDARLEDLLERGRAPLREPGRNAPGCGADIRAVEAQADATAHPDHIVFCKVRIGARGAGLSTCEALLDAANQAVEVAGRSGRMGKEDFSD